MDKVKCIKAVVMEGTDEVVATVGRVYDVVDVDSGCFAIYDDVGDHHWFEYFANIDEHDSSEWFVEVVEAKLPNTIIILNAPPNSGKDSIAKAISERTGASHSEFKENLYQCTSTLFNVRPDVFKALAVDRHTKEVNRLDLSIPLGNYKSLQDVTGMEWVVKEEDDVFLSPREAMIYTSEVVIKPSFGDDYFGRMAASIIDKSTGAVFSDGGFIEELIPALREVGAENVFVVKMSRKGCSFEGDSRDYLDTPEGVNELVLNNNGTIEEATNKILSWISEVRLDQQS